MTLRLNGSASGYTELEAAPVAGNNKITFPASSGSSGQILKNSNGVLDWSQIRENADGSVSLVVGSAAAPSVTFTGDTNTGIYSPGADQVAISTGGSGRLFINSNGDVGVGTGGTQGTKLHAVGGNIWSGNFYEVGRFQKSSGTAISLGYDNSDYVATVGAYSHDGTPSNLSFWTYPGSGAVQERLRITSAGLVGVGTSSPSDIVHINKASTAATVAYLSNTGGEARIGVENNSGTGVLSGAGAYDTVIRTAASTGISFGIGYTAPAIRIDSSGRLGVGTTDPGSYGANLAVIGSGNGIVAVGQATSYTTFQSNGQDFYLNLKGTGSTVFRRGSGDTESVRIDGSGRVGIGTSAPSNQAHIYRTDSGTSNGALRLDGNGNYAGLQFAASGTNYGSIAADNATLYITHANGISFRTGNSGNVGGTDRLFVDSSGRLGIGTTAPGEALTVGTGNAQVTSGQLTVGVTSTSGLQFINDGTFGTLNSIPLIFRTVSSERARIDTSGRLLVGTSTARVNYYNSAGIGSNFQVVGSTHAESSIILHNQAANTQGAYFHIGKSRGTAYEVVNNDDPLGVISFQGADGSTMREGASITAFVDGVPGASDLPTRLVFSTTADGASSPTERMRISQNGLTRIFVTNGDGFQSDISVAAGTATATFVGRHSATGIGNGTTSFIVWSNGNVVNTNNSYGAISDIKLKENIVDATSQWSDIKALQVRKYNFKEGQTHTQIGLVAQEVELVSPGLVTESPDRDAKGNDLGTVTKSVNYSVLYMKAVKALQEAMERIETLEAENAHQKAALTDILSRISALEGA